MAVLQSIPRVCDDSVCETCLNDATLLRFFATGAYETICNGCIPASACADPDGLTTKFIGDRKHSYCILCQDWHELNSDGAVDCTLEPQENSPLARFCIEHRATQMAGNTKKSTTVGTVPTPDREGSTPRPQKASETAREIQRDTMLVDMQLQISEMECRLSKQIERSLSLKMAEFQKKSADTAQSLSLDKCVQVDKNDLKAADALYKAHKARENPTQHILDSLPKIIETISKSIENSYRFQNGAQNLPNKKGQGRKFSQKAPKNRQNGQNSQNGNQRR